MATVRGYLLPEKIGDNTHFTWGHVREVHKIPGLEITVVEYNCPDVQFSVYFKNKECNISYSTLEEAIIAGIAINNLGMESTFNGSYVECASKILGVYDKEK